MLHTGEARFLASFDQCYTLADRYVRELNQGGVKCCQAGKLVDPEPH